VCFSQWNSVTFPTGDKTFEDYVGAAGLKRLGMKKWQRKVADVVERLTAALQPEYVVLGGGNAKKNGTSSAQHSAWQGQGRFCRRIETLGQLQSAIKRAED
jgi:predicted NBD/HSP70 family sugar kinase